MNTVENPSNCGSQNGKAKSNKATVVAQIARIVRKAGLDYDGWRMWPSRSGRLATCPATKGRRLPRVLTAAEFRHFYAIVDQAEDVQHSLDAAAFFFTAVRVSELCKSRWPTWIWRRAKSSSTRARGRRTATSFSARVSPRPCGRTSPPTRITVSCSRPSGHEKFSTGGCNRL